VYLLVTNPELESRNRKVVLGRGNLLLLWRSKHNIRSI
jgi:hypothetical protein